MENITCQIFLYPQKNKYYVANKASGALTANYQVSKEEPARDKWLSGIARGFAHDVQVGWVEAQSGRRQTVRHQIHPQQLNWNQSFGEAQSCR